MLETRKPLWVREMGDVCNSPRLGQPLCPAFKNVHMPVGERLPSHYTVATIQSSPQRLLYGVLVLTQLHNSHVAVATCPPYHVLQHSRPQSPF